MKRSVIAFFIFFVAVAYANPIITPSPTEIGSNDTCKNKKDDQGNDLKGHCEGGCQEGQCTDCRGVRKLCKVEGVPGLMTCKVIEEEVEGGGCKCDKDVMSLCPQPLPTPTDPKKDPCYKSVKNKDGTDKYPFCTPNKGIGGVITGCHGQNKYQCENNAVNCNDGNGGPWSDSFPCPTPTPKPKRTLVGGEPTVTY